MKKGQVIDGIVSRVEFPNKGIVMADIVDGNEMPETEAVVIKNVIEGQRVRGLVNKVRHKKAEARLLEVLAKSPLEIEACCEHFGSCGGCSYQTLPYEQQLQLKESQVKQLMTPIFIKQKDKGFGGIEVFEGIKGSPKQFEYRNKMEFSFGDEFKGGDLSLGMHKRGSFYDILYVPDCQIIDEDFRSVLRTVLDFCKENELPFYHKMSHEGYLRHLLVRHGEKTGELLVAIVTSSQLSDSVLDGLADRLKSLTYNGELVGVLHTVNDSLADVVQSDRTEILYGRDYLYEELLDLRFKVSEFSFFQTNTLGAEVLYNTAREYAGAGLGMTGSKKPVIYDLYSGTGTIAQLMAPIASKVVGVEIVEEAVFAARENAKINGLDNCEFIAGDVLKVIDDIEDKPDYIILDPPRDGIHPKALPKIIKYGIPQMVYISCKPTSLARDLEVFLEHGYHVERMCCVDMFPGTGHVETVVLICRQN